MKATVLFRAIPHQHWIRTEQTDQLPISNFGTVTEFRNLIESVRTHRPLII